MASLETAADALKVRRVVRRVDNGAHTFEVVIAQRLTSRAALDRSCLYLRETDASPGQMFSKTRSRAVFWAARHLCRVGARISSVV